MPLVGLLSDSHGRAATTRRAVGLLVERGATLLVHLGDVGGEAVIDELLVPAPGGGVLEAHVVFGNCDFDVTGLTRYARDLGMAVDHPVGRLRFGGRELAFTHGDDGRAVQAELERGVDWLCFGHTHRRQDGRQGGTRLINPGALHRASEYSVATLDTDSDELTFYLVGRA